MSFPFIVVLRTCARCTERKNIKFFFLFYFFHKVTKVSVYKFYIRCCLSFCGCHQYYSSVFVCVAKFKGERSMIDDDPPVKTVDSACC